MAGFFKNFLQGRSQTQREQASPEGSMIVQPKEPALWNTMRATAIAFALFWVYGVYRATREYSWSAGFEFKLAIVSQGIGAGLIPAIIAALVCLEHNYRVKRNRQRAAASSMFD